MLSRSLVAAALAASLLVAAGCSSAAKDADNLCRIATEVVADSKLDPAQRALRLASRFEATKPTAKVRQMFGAIAAAPPERKHALLRQGFKELGVDFKCPALEKLMKAPKAQ